MMILREQGPPSTLVPATEALQRESTPFETQHVVVAAQAAHQLLEAVDCPSHGDFLPNRLSMSIVQKKQAARPWTGH
jgi:hypothetical protein